MVGWRLECEACGRRNVSLRMGRRYALLHERECSVCCLSVRGQRATVCVLHYN